MSIVIHFLVMAVIFAVIDVLWITVVANKFYKSQLGSLLRPKALLLPAVLFYGVYLLGLVIFALQPGLDAHSWWVAAWHAGFFGLACYATYDLTNAATLKNWPQRLTVVDLLWGTVLSTTVVSIVYALFTR